jgi:hypothetical protein
MPALHRPPSPPGRPAQGFVFGGWVVDITAAVGSIIRDAPRVTVSLPIAPWAGAYGRDRDPGTIPLLPDDALICHRLFSAICRFPQWPGFGRPPRSDRS